MQRKYQPDPLRQWLASEARPTNSYVPFTWSCDFSGDEVTLAANVHKWLEANLTVNGQWTASYFFVNNTPEKGVLARIVADNTYGRGVEAWLELRDVLIRAEHDSIHCFRPGEVKQEYTRHITPAGGPDTWVMTAEQKKIYYDRKIFEQGDSYPARLELAMADLDRRVREWIHGVLRKGAKQGDIYRFPPLTDMVCTLSLAYGKDVMVMDVQPYLQADTPAAEFTKVRNAFRRLQDLVNLNTFRNTAPPMEWMQEQYYEFLVTVATILQFNTIADLRKRFDGTVETGRQMNEYQPVPPPAL